MHAASSSRSPDAPVPPAVKNAHAAHAALSAASIDVDTEDARALIATARTALAQDQVDDALALVTAALALSPQSAQAWVLAGDIAWQRHDVQQARDAWEEALSLDDRDLVTAVRCARAQLATGAVRQARALLTYVVARTNSAPLRDEAESILDETASMTAGGAK